MISSELVSFYESWRKKADVRFDLHNLNHYFDAYFSYFVVFNRLYAEATFVLARTNQIQIRGNAFPDAKAAKEYALQFMEARYFVSEIEKDESCYIAIETIKDLLVKKSFSIKLDIVYGYPKPEEDFALLNNISSTNSCVKGKAILDFLYTIRCNMFHGQKEFALVQVEILHPSIVLLRKTCEILFDKLHSSTE